MTDTVPRRLRGFLLDTRPLRIPAYRRLWLAGMVTTLGAQMTVVAVPKQIYDLTGSSAYVGLAGLVGFAPLLVFGLWGGAVADMMDRRRLLLLTTLGTAGVLLLLWSQAAAGIGSISLIMLLFAAQQAMFAINHPASSASIARLVPGEQLPQAGALNALVFQAGSVFGPLLAGMILPVIGLEAIYLIDAIAMTAMLWAVWRLPPLPPNDTAPRSAGLREVLAGFRYLATQRVLLASYLVDIIAMVFGMPRALFPEMAERTFGDPPGGGLALGLLFAAIPLGSMLCGLSSGWLKRVNGHGAAVTIAVIVWGLSMIGFALSDSLWWAVLFLAVGGAADLVSMVFRGAIMQEAATDEMRGRVQGSFIVVVAGGPRLADLLHGTSAAVVGTTIATAGGGVLVVLCTALAVLALPAFWRYRSPSATPTAG